MNETTNDDTDLVPAWAATEMTPREVFMPASVQKILEAVEARARAEVPDLSTAKGRQAIASLAFKVARSKTFLDNVGKDLAADWKKQAANVDVLRRTIRDRLDALKDEVRAPLTQWEEAEKERKLRVDAALLRLSNTAQSVINSPPGLSASAMEAEIAKFEAEQRPTQEDFGESFEVATENYERCLERMRAALLVRKAQEAAAEAERRIKAAEEAAVEAERRAAALQRKLEAATAVKVEPEQGQDRSIPSVEEAHSLIDKLNVSTTAAGTAFDPHSIAAHRPGATITGEHEGAELVARVVANPEFDPEVTGLDHASKPDRTVVAQITPGSVRIMRDFGYPLNRDPVARINLQAEIQRMIADAVNTPSIVGSPECNNPILEELADKIIAKVCDTLSELAGPVAA